MNKTVSFVAAVAVSAMLLVSACHSNDEGAENVPQAPSQPVPNQPNTQNR